MMNQSASDNPDRSSWLLVNILKDILKIDGPWDTSSMDTFWTRFEEKIALLKSPMNMKDDNIEKRELIKILKTIDKNNRRYFKKIKKGIENGWLMQQEELKNKLLGYDLDSLDLTYFIDMFDIQKCKLLEIQTRPELNRLITNSIKEVIMTDSYEMLKKRRKALAEMKYCELGAFSRVSAALQEQSSKLAKAIEKSTGDLKKASLVEINIELGINYLPITAKVGLKFVIKS